MWAETAYPGEKKQMYELLARQLSGLVEGERERIPNLANASALLVGALEQINWAGFYLMKDGMLVLGPFQGKPACIRIPVGRGVCGTAAKTLQIQRVADVHLFPGHIACDAQSQSEIVIPMLAQGRLVGVLDIDSPVTNRFDEQDEQGLQTLVDILTRACQWPA